MLLRGYWLSRVEPQASPGPNGLIVELLTPLLVRRPFLSKQDYPSPVNLGGNSSFTVESRNRWVDH